jgi:hypothetical protein
LQNALKNGIKGGCTNFCLLFGAKACFFRFDLPSHFILPKLWHSTMWTIFSSWAKAGPKTEFSAKQARPLTEEKVQRGKSLFFNWIFQKESNLSIEPIDFLSHCIENMFPTLAVIFSSLRFLKKPEFFPNGNKTREKIDSSNLHNWNYKENSKFSLLWVEKSGELD